MRQKKETLIRNQAIVDEYTDGVEVEQIAYNFHITKDYVRKILKKAGVYVNVKKTKEEMQPQPKQFAPMLPKENRLIVGQTIYRDITT